MIIIENILNFVYLLLMFKAMNIYKSNQADIQRL